MDNEMQANFAAVMNELKSLHNKVDKSHEENKAQSLALESKFDKLSTDLLQLRTAQEANVIAPVAPKSAAKKKRGRRKKAGTEREGVPAEYIWRLYSLWKKNLEASDYDKVPVASLVRQIVAEVDREQLFETVTATDEQLIKRLENKFSSLRTEASSVVDGKPVLDQDKLAQLVSNYKRHGNDNLTGAETLSLLAAIRHVNGHKRAVKESQILSLAKVVIPDKNLNDDWAHRWYERHKKVLTKTNRKGKTKGRLDESVYGKVLEFFDRYQKKLDQFKRNGIKFMPKLIINADETLITVVNAHEGQQKKVCFRHYVDKLERVKDATLGSMTPFVGSDGTTYLVVYCWKSTKSDRTSVTVLKERKNTRLAGTRVRAELHLCSQSGYMDQEAFDLATDKLASVLDEQNVRDAKADPVILLCDNLGIHKPGAQELEQKHNIHTIFLAPNSSHFLQPLDNCVFAVLKRLLRKLTNEFRCEKLMVWGEDPQPDDPIYVLAEAVDKALDPDMIQKSFRNTGIWPMDSRKASAAAAKRLAITDADSRLALFKSLNGDDDENDPEALAALQQANENDEQGDEGGPEARGSGVQPEVPAADSGHHCISNLILQGTLARLDVGLRNAEDRSMKRRESALRVRIFKQGNKRSAKLEDVVRAEQQHQAGRAAAKEQERLAKKRRTEERTKTIPLPRDSTSVGRVLKAREEQKGRKLTQQEAIMLAKAELKDPEKATQLRAAVVQAKEQYATNMVRYVTALKEASVTAAAEANEAESKRAAAGDDQQLAEFAAMKRKLASALADNVVKAQKKSEKAHQRVRDAKAASQSGSTAEESGDSEDDETDEESESIELLSDHELPDDHMATDDDDDDDDSAANQRWDDENDEEQWEESVAVNFRCVAVDKVLFGAKYDERAPICGKSWSGRITEQQDWFCDLCGKREQTAETGNPVAALCEDHVAHNGSCLNRHKNTCNGNGKRQRKRKRFD